MRLFATLRGSALLFGRAETGPLARALAACAVVLFFLAGPASAACPTSGDYAEGLCRYRTGDYERAEKLFAAVVERGELAPETIKAEYFLARTRMRLKKFDDAAKGLMRIYSLDQAFYKEWSCDFLLGECRRALGLG